MLIEQYVVHDNNFITRTDYKKTFYRTIRSNLKQFNLIKST